MKQPATPLPWEVDDEAQICSGNFVVACPPTATPANHADDDAAYIAHAANAYPKLVGLLQTVEANAGSDLAGIVSVHLFATEIGEIRALLRELGESE